MNDLSTAPHVAFAPRRMGHANIFVSKLDRSLDFYNNICGLEEVRREPGIAAGFMSNGNTHHDVGLMETGGQVRVGLGGHVQIPKGRGREPGLNHIGWEMDRESDLVEAYRRATRANLKIHRLADHQLAHSIYVFDPDGNLHEFYADVVADWRTVFNPDREDLITGEWRPLAQPPQTKRRWKVKPEVRKVVGAVFQPTRISRGVMVARNFPRMKAFFTEVGGLSPTGPETDEAVLLRGCATKRDIDLALFVARDGLVPGMHHFTFDIADEAKLAAAEKRAVKAGATIEIIVDRPHKRSVFIADPDGLRLEFRSRRPGKAPALADMAPGLRPYLI